MSVDARRRLHSLTGLVPLAAFFLFHVWEQAAIRSSREVLLDRMTRASAPVLEMLLVLVPLLAHALLGLTLPRAASDDRRYASPAFRGLQRSSGVVLGLFLLWHVSSVWWPRTYQRGGAVPALAALLDDLGTLPGAGLYLLGTSAAALHFGQGLAAAWLRQVPTTSPRVARTAAGLFALALWLLIVDILSAHVAGTPLV